jgi:hypothetical protein
MFLARNSLMKKLIIGFISISCAMISACTNVPAQSASVQSSKGQFSSEDTPPLSLKPIKQEQASADSNIEPVIPATSKNTLEIVPIAKKWTLAEGKTVSRELSGWGKTVGWNVIWNLDKDWAIPSNTTYIGDFKSAAGEVVKTLAANGILIRAQFYDGNKTMVVFGPGVSEQ